MAREIRDDLLSDLLSRAPGAYKGDPVLDRGSTSEGTSTVPPPASERWLLEADNDRYWAQHPLQLHAGTVVPASAVDLVKALPAGLLGRRDGEAPPQPVRVPLPGGGETELSRELSRPMSVAERQELARQAPGIWESGNPDVGLHPNLPGGSGDPVADNLGPEGW